MYGLRGCGTKFREKEKIRCNFDMGTMISLGSRMTFLNIVLNMVKKLPDRQTYQNIRGVLFKKRLYRQNLKSRST